MSRIDELYARYRDALVKKLVQFGQRLEDAEDIAQETLIATWKRLDELRPGEEWVYLKVAAHNNAHKRFRRANVPRRGGGLLTPLENEHDAEDGSPTAEAELIKRQEIAAFRARFNTVITQFPPETQQALVLRRQGRNSEQIAQTLGLTDQAVRTRLSRAMAIIRERVGVPPAGVDWADLGDDDDHEN